uniref:Asp/Glu/hydantoin racemase n=1 Tax=Marseillevirus LCMAC102 TaxID=2506603 RepID=A0A481YT21_9VIRU|nr:MAG: Asp/Glu/hydantoin racemase [Marseillevirus LCMAC102]
MDNPFIIGIIDNSGDTGIDMMRKLIIALRMRNGVSQPSFVLESDVRMAHASQKLTDEGENIKEKLWEYMGTLIFKFLFVHKVDVFCISCNTLHIFQDRIVDLLDKYQIPRTKFVSFVDVVTEHIKTNKLTRVGLVGSLITTDLETNSLSPFQCLTKLQNVQIVVSQRNEFQDIITEVKKNGYSTYISNKFRRLLNNIDAPIYLACTEFSLLGKFPRTIDVTDLVVDKMVERIVRIGIR